MEYAATDLMQSNYLLKQIVYALCLFVSLIENTKGVQCVTCPPSESNHQCNLIGRVEKCASDQFGFAQSACFTEIRIHGGVYKIRKGCSQSLSCKVQQMQNNALFLGVKFGSSSRRCNGGPDNSVCHHCCGYDFCNLSETPKSNGANHSCSHFYPGCRATWWHERGGFLTDNAIFLGCHCDKVCVQLGDCCFDYHDVCVGVLPRGLRSRDPYGGTTGGEYKKVIRRGGGLPLLRCYVCDNASSNEECNRKGRIEECLPNQRSCLTKTRLLDGRRVLSKRCSHKLSCEALQSTTSCNKHGVCYSCCGIDYCNVFERPHEVNFASSCLTAYPGYPQCRRVDLSSCGENAQCKVARCRCDTDCTLYNDCCSDYNQLCSEGRDENLGWIFHEIRRNRPDEGEGELDLSRFEIRADVPLSEMYTVIRNKTFKLDMTSHEVEEMKKAQKKTLASLANYRATTGKSFTNFTAQVSLQTNDATATEDLT